MSFAIFIEFHTGLVKFFERYMSMNIELVTSAVKLCGFMIGKHVFDRFYFMFSIRAKPTPSVLYCSFCLLLFCLKSPQTEST